MTVISIFDKNLWKCTDKKKSTLSSSALGINWDDSTKKKQHSFFAATVLHMNENPYITSLSHNIMHTWNML